MEDLYGKRLKGIETWLQDQRGNNWEADHEMGAVHRVKLEEDVCGDGSQHEMAVWRYTGPAPTRCHTNLTQGIINLAAAAARDSTDILNIIIGGDFFMPNPVLHDTASS